MHPKRELRSRNRGEGGRHRSGRPSLAGSPRQRHGDGRGQESADPSATKLQLRPRPGPVERAAVEADGEMFGDGCSLSMAVSGISTSESERSAHASHRADSAE
jgi:hypothetical protein